MADIELVLNENNFNYDFTLYDEDGTVDLTDFDTNTLDIRPTDLTSALILDSKALTKPSGTSGVLRWNVLVADLSSPSEGTMYYAQITITDSVNNVTRKSKLMTLKMENDIEA